MASEHAKGSAAGSAGRGLDSLVRDLRDRHAVRAGLLGESPATLGLFERVRRLASARVPVLIAGEEGAGKGAVARALHLNSERSAAPFVVEACAALRGDVCPRQLFGHVRGAFTGAGAGAPGLLDLADGGSLYLDEVADLPRESQATLARVLETGEYRPLGSPELRRSDFRLLASTSADLLELMRAGLFRRDLYFRLRGALIHVPPLRERGRDVLALARAVLRDEEHRSGCSPPVLSDEAAEALVGYTWPGNVRELQHELLQAIAMAESGRITPACFQFLRDPPPIAAERRRFAALGHLRDELNSVEAAAIRDALHHAGGNKAEAARRLGLTRRTLYRRIDAIAAAEREQLRAAAAK